MTTSILDAAVAPPTDFARDTASRINAYNRDTNKTRALLLEQIAVFDEHDLAHHFGAASTASWLARELRYPVPTAYEYVRVARALRRFPLVFAAFAEGELDYSTVRFLIGFLTEENEAELVELARALCHSELKRALAGAGEEDDADPAEPYFRTHTRDDGMLEGSFLLPAVTGQQLLAALKIAELAASGLTDDETGPAAEDDDAVAEDAAAEPAEPAEPAEEVPAPAEEVPAEAAPEPAEAEPAEACPATMVQGPRKTGKITISDILRLPSRYGPPLRDAMYDSFVTMINMVRTTPTSPLRAPGAHVNIICTEDGKVWMPDNPQAPSRAVKAYVANAIAHGHLLDSRGLTLFVGRQQRLATDGQIAALLAVWGNQCAMPGCTHGRFMEIHHIHEWADGGETDIGNLIPLCSSCHSKVSHGLADIRINGGEIEFSFIDGSRYVTKNRCLPRRDADFEGPLRGYTNPDDLTFG